MPFLEVWLCFECCVHIRGVFLVVEKGWGGGAVSPFQTREREKKKSLSRSFLTLSLSLSLLCKFSQRQDSDVILLFILLRCCGKP